MKTALSTCMVALVLLLTINNNMRTQASKARRVLKDNEPYEFVVCCLMKGCPLFIYRKHPRTCKIMYIGKTLSCRCVDVFKRKFELTN